MKKITMDGAASSPGESPVWETLETYARERIHQFVQQMLEEEVDDLLGRKKSERRSDADAAGYRNGRARPRQLALSSGTITVRRPRVRNLDARLRSRLLPLFKRRTEEVGALLPELYLHGLSLGDFDRALRGLLGDAAPRSPSSILRWKEEWQHQFTAWKRRDLSEFELVYLWADGIYVKAGLEREKAALLVLVGALSNGEKVILAVESGHRESSESWSAVLRDLNARGLRAPRRTIADGHLGIWSALKNVYPTSREQRCWNHKMRNVLDTIAQKHQPEVKRALQEIASAETEPECERLRRAFEKTYARVHPKAVERLSRDWERMTTYYRFPTAHWKHIRTTNVIESPFAAVRLRTGAAKRFKKVENATALIWKMLLVVQENFRKLNAPHLLADVYAGVEYHDGVRALTTTREQLAA
ncbi:MAG: IS256 family transposase [Gemmatimonadaceae bacterium]